MNNTIFYDVPSDVNIKYIENSTPRESGIKKLLKLPFLAFKYASLCKTQHWFKYELKDVLFDKIESLDERFDKANIRKLANMHVYKNRNYEYVLWNLMRVR